MRNSHKKRMSFLDWKINCRNYKNEMLISQKLLSNSEKIFKEAEMSSKNYKLRGWSTRTWVKKSFCSSIRLGPWRGDATMWPWRQRRHLLSPRTRSESLRRRSSSSIEIERILNWLYMECKSIIPCWRGSWLRCGRSSKVAHFQESRHIYQHRPLEALWLKWGLQEANMVLNHLEEE